MQRPRLNHFHTYEEYTAYLQEAQKAYPDIMDLQSLAVTEDGYSIWAVTLCKGGNPEDKPAFYVQGGIHAQEGMGITCSLNFLWTVLEQHQEILDNLTVYILPCVNPAGSDLCVRTGINVRSKLERIYGLPNAVVPQDLDGDGKILSMRWIDPAGRWVSLPECGDMMVPRCPGDKGPFYSMITEGIVENYNGGELQRGYRDLDFNRQYALDWKNNINGGDFPGNHIESYTIMKFMSTHSNIFMIMDVHCGTRALIYATPSNLEDTRLYRELAFLGGEITGIEPITHERYGRRFDSPPSNLKGHIDDYCYEALGIPSITVELGNGYNSMGMKAQEIFDASLYNREWISKIVAMHKEKGRVIALPWKPFKHPQLGDIEVGGQFHHNAYFMDPDDMLDLIPKVADYFLRVADMVPTLAFADATCEAVADGIYRVRAKVINDSGMYSKVLYGATGYQAIRDVIRLSIDGAAEILSGNKTPSVASLEPNEVFAAEWFVRAKPGDQITIKASFPKAVNAVATIVAE
jgi:predicted deacylase